MATIDERVVSMAFENSSFERAASVTLNTLSKLDSAIRGIGHVNGLSELDRGVAQTAGRFSSITSAAQRVDISSLSRGVGAVTNAFSVLEGAAAVALGSIAAKAALAGGNIVKNLSLGPITDGFQEYATNLNSIQTILANTQAEGANLQDVNSALGQLNKYSDETIYNFSQMAKNIGTFTAAGVKLKPATESIKGIANLAALSGSNSEQASTAMYQLSQAIAAGKVNLQDWNSVVNAGMGGKVFQKALFDTGKAMGTITNSPVGQTFEEWEKAGNNFRQSLSATQKAAADGTKNLKEAQKDAAKTIKDAHEQAAQSIVDAAERVKDAQKAEAEAITTAAQRVRDAQQQAADDTKAAAEKVKEAQNGVAEASKQASEDIRAAVDAQTENTKRSAEDVKNALDAVVEARKRLADAMKPPSADELQAATDKLTTAQLDQADLADAITLAQREQERSAQDLADAQKKLADLRAAGADASDILAATRAVEDAQTRATDAADAVTRATLKQNAANRDLHQSEQDLADVKKKGTDADQNVIDSRDALTIATDKYVEAQKKARKDEIAAAKAVSDARQRGIRDQREAGQRLTDAEKDQARIQIKARQDVAKAEKDQRDTIIQARADVAKAEQEQAKVIKDARETEADAAEQASKRIQDARAALDGPGQGPPSWLTSDVLTNTLRQFTGDMTKAQLKAQGFTDAQADAILKIADTAKKSATEVKTIGQLFGVVKEAIGTGWADTFRIIFGDFGEAKKTFTTLSNYIGGFIANMSAARNKVLKDWKALGGRTELIEGIKNAFHALLEILKPIRNAFRDIFPAQTGKTLFELTKRFREFTESLTPSQATLDGLRRTFRGFFAAIHIGFAIVKELVGLFFDLFGAADQSSGGFLKFTGNIGDMVTRVDAFLTKGGALHAFFKTLGAVLKVPIALVSDFVTIIKNLFTSGQGDEANKFSAAMGAVGDSLKPLGRAADKVREAWEKLKDIFGRIGEIVGPIVTNVADALRGIGGAIADAFKNIDTDKVLLGLQTGLLAAIVVYLKKFLSGGIKVNVGGGFLGKIRESLEALTGTLKAVQQNLQAGTLLKIGAAIAVLAAAILILSTIDPDKLKKALAAIAVGLGELIAAMALLTKIGGAGAFITLPILATGLIALSTALVILAAAMKIFATMKWEEIGKGMAGVAGGLTAIGIGMKFIGATRLIPMSLGLIAVGVALNIIALAMKIFATMSWEEIGKGLAGVGGGLVAIGAGLLFMGPSLILIGPGLVAAAFGINILAAAIKIFGSMDLVTLGRGIGGVAGSMVALGLALLFMPPGPALLLQGAGLVVVATGLGILAGAMKVMASIKLGSLVKAIAAVAIILVELAVGLTLMAGTLPGSVALLAAAAAFAVLGPAIAFMGSLDWTTILKGLTTMALTMGVLAVGGLLAAPALAALGIALIPLGAGLILVAGAVYLAAKGISLLGQQGPKVITALTLALTALVTLLPMLVINFVKGLVAIIEEIAKVAPKVALALGVIIDTFLATIISAAPKVAEAVGALITAFIDVIANNAGPLIAAGFTLLVNFLQGVANNIGKVVETGFSIVKTFLDKMTAHIPDFVKQGGTMLLKFLSGIVLGLPQVVAKAGQVVVTFLTELAKRIPSIIAAGARLLVSVVKGITGQVGKVVSAGVGLILALLEGIGNAIPRLVRGGLNVARKFLNGIADGLSGLADIGFKAIIRFLNGLAKAIRENNDDLFQAGANVASAIIDGLVQQFGKLGGVLRKALEQVFKLLPHWARKILGIASPSKVFIEIGSQVMAGMAIGLDNGGDAVKRSVESVANDVVKTASDTFKGVGNSLDGIMDVDPVITPVIDLSEVEKGVAKLDGLTQTAPIVATVSTGAAGDISAETAAMQATLADQAAQAAQVQQFSFEQNNYSPESLSDTEIYRQTNNQLAQAKKALGLT